MPRCPRRQKNSLEVELLVNQDHGGSEQRNKMCACLYWKPLPACFGRRDKSPTTNSAEILGLSGLMGFKNGWRYLNIQEDQVTALKFWSHSQLFAMNVREWIIEGSLTHITPTVIINTIMNKFRKKGNEAMDATSKCMPNRGRGSDIRLHHSRARSTY